MSERVNPRSVAPAASLLASVGAFALPGIAVRLSFVGHDDRGSRDRLFPDTAILVQPCDGYVGQGHYQLLAPLGPVVRRCFALNAQTVRISDLSRIGAPQFEDLTAEAFADLVCGLVIGALDLLDADLAAELHAKRLPS
jgi:hypothetical protein